MPSPLASILETALVAVVTAPIEERVFDWAVAVSKGGIHHLGVPVTLPNVTELVSDLDDQELVVGLSGVVKKEQVSIAVAAGGAFIISPIADREILHTAKSHGLCAIAGATTPTEIKIAMDAGADIIAVHPLGVLGAPQAYAKSLLRTFPSVRFAASGNIGVEDAPSFLELGMNVAIVDQGLFPSTNDPAAIDVITMRALALTEVCADARGTPQRQSFTGLMRALGQDETPPLTGELESAASPTEAGSGALEFDITDELS